MHEEPLVGVLTGPVNSSKDIWPEVQLDMDITWKVLFAIIMIVYT